MPALRVQIPQVQKRVPICSQMCGNCVRYTFANVRCCRLGVSCAPHPTPIFCADAGAVFRRLAMRRQRSGRRTGRRMSRSRFGFRLAAEMSCFRMTLCIYCASTLLAQKGSNLELYTFGEGSGGLVVAGRRKAIGGSEITNEVN